MNGDTTLTISAVIAIIGCIIAVITFFRTISKDTKQDVKSHDTEMHNIKESLLKANLKLDQVCNTTTETRSDIKALNKDIKDIDKRVVILERDQKTIWSRIDDMKQEH